MRPAFTSANPSLSKTEGDATSQLYLYATFVELRYGFDRAEEAPDFICIGPLGEFFVEATTVSSVGQAVPANEQQYYDRLRTNEIR